MLAAKGTNDSLNLNILGDIPVSQTLSMNLHFTGLTIVRSSSCFELNETDVTSGFFDLFRLTLLLLIVDYG
jgi:hypothetical protein